MYSKVEYLKLKEELGKQRVEFIRKNRRGMTQEDVRKDKELYNKTKNYVLMKDVFEPKKKENAANAITASRRPLSEVIKYATSRRLKGRKTKASSSQPEQPAPAPAVDNIEIAPQDSQDIPTSQPELPVMDLRALIRNIDWGFDINMLLDVTKDCECGVDVDASFGLTPGCFGFNFAPEMYVSSSLPRMRRQESCTRLPRVSSKPRLLVAALANKDWLEEMATAKVGCEGLDADDDCPMFY